nr:immunoglobulin light chain junction region [Macaca mulatta]
CMQGAELWTF